MNKKEIETNYKKKIKLLTKYNKNYYDKISPLVSDKDYDNLKHDLLLLEQKYKFLNSSNSPSKIFGYKPSQTFKKSLHRVPMLSLVTAYSEADLINFVKSSLEFISETIISKIYYIS